jgi:hypothetical protein
VTVLEADESGEHRTEDQRHLNRPADRIAAVQIDRSTEEDDQNDDGDESIEQ